MTILSLLQRNLLYYWRTNLAVVTGVATAVAVLAGALLVGDSVRESLRGLALARLGRTDLVVAGTSFFRERLAEEMQAGMGDRSPLVAAVPLIALTGLALEDETQARAGGVAVYGVDRRFWEFHGVEVATPEGNEALVSRGLAAELGLEAGDSLVVRVEKPSPIPLESLFGRKDDAGRTMRVTVREILAPERLGEFSLQPSQGMVRAVFLPLGRVQRNLDQDALVNALLLAARPGPAEAAIVVREGERLVRERFTLTDLGLRLRQADSAGTWAVESASGVLSEPIAAQVRKMAGELGLETASFLTYLANTIRRGEREVPYSLVTALEIPRGATRSAAVPPTLLPVTGATTPESPRNGVDTHPPLVLNQWAAKDLDARPGDLVSLDYYLWREDGTLGTATTTFRLAGVTPLEGLAADRNLVPEYPGITGSESLSDWDPPFPLDLGRIRKVDEDYWDQYRTTPKAYLPLTEGQSLWTTRHGRLTSLRLIAPVGPLGQTLATSEKDLEERLRRALDPLAFGVAVQSVRAENLAASRGATDFGAYFSYFSFFLMASALLLVALFFRLGLEQRARELGLYWALGFSGRQVRWLFLREGALLAGIGSLLGIGGALLYGALMMFGLRTWWVGAVGTSLLQLHINPGSLLVGGLAGVGIALIAIALTLRSLSHSSPRRLLAGSLVERATGQGRLTRVPFHRRNWFSVLLMLVAAGLLLGVIWKGLDPAAGFFGVGTLLLLILLLSWSRWLHYQEQGTGRSGLGGHPMFALGLRNATRRPERSLLCVALIAAATFLLVSVEAFRRGTPTSPENRQSGTGGFGLVAESQLPIVHHPDLPEGRAELGLESPILDGSRITRFRLRAGEDTSCLNLYQPRKPRLLGVPATFIQEGRFSFGASLAETEAERANPWELLRRRPSPTREGEPPVVPVIADANSLAYVLHRKVGEELELIAGDGQPVRLRIVAALADSLFQGELLMAEEDLLRLFPAEVGYRWFAVDLPPAQLTPVAAFLEDRLADYGFDAVSAAEKLARFHEVENTYLSTFQTLGGLGLLLGTVGLAIVLLRNVLERRAELALMQAVGYRQRHLSVQVLAENLLLLGVGLLIGCLSAAVAIGPALSQRGGHLLGSSLVLLLLAVLITGMLASLLALRALARSPLLAALRGE
ncbi:MAG: FtsX-like permease family protein [Blastocatellia bacterium]